MNVFVLTFFCSFIFFSLIPSSFGCNFKRCKFCPGTSVWWQGDTTICCTMWLRFCWTFFLRERFCCTIWLNWWRSQQKNYKSICLPLHLRFESLWLLLFLQWVFVCYLRFHFQVHSIPSAYFSAIAFFHSAIPPAGTWQWQSVTASVSLKKACRT